MKSKISEFPFCADLPAVEDLTPRGELADLIRELRADRYTMVQIARLVSPSLSWRTVEAWAQNRSLPAPWVCELILEKISCNGR